MKIEQMIVEVQQALGLQPDGKPGPLTWGAIHNALVQPAAPPAPAFTEAGDRASARSERVIATLHPAVQPYARALYFAAREHGITMHVISGLRSYEEQAELYAKGRTTRGPKVTNARPGYSNHNFGLAFDVGVFEGDDYLGDSPKYKALGVLGTDLGLEWGGNWRSIQDQPHFQLRPPWATDLSDSAMLAECRRRRDAEVDYFAA
jgi:peptidoglycan L-alanyl-D-glutamate endopeptidase CwlK